MLATFMEILDNHGGERFPPALGGFLLVGWACPGTLDTPTQAARSRPPEAPPASNSFGCIVYSVRWLTSVDKIKGSAQHILQVTVCQRATVQRQVELAIIVAIGEEHWRGRLREPTARNGMGNRRKSPRTALPIQVGVGSCSSQSC